MISSRRKQWWVVKVDYLVLEVVSLECPHARSAVAFWVDTGVIIDIY